MLVRFHRCSLRKHATTLPATPNCPVAGQSASVGSGPVKLSSTGARPPIANNARPFSPTLTCVVPAKTATDENWVRCWFQEDSQRIDHSCLANSARRQHARTAAFRVPCKLLQSYTMVGHKTRAAAAKGSGGNAEGAVFVGLVRSTVGCETSKTQEPGQPLSTTQPSYRWREGSSADRNMMVRKRSCSKNGRFSSLGWPDRYRSVSTIPKF